MCAETIEENYAVTIGECTVTIGECTQVVGTITECAQQPLRNVHNNHCGMCTAAVAESRGCIHFSEYKSRRMLLLREAHSSLLLKRQSKQDGNRNNGGKGGL